MYIYLIVVFTGLQVSVLRALSFLWFWTKQQLELVEMTGGCFRPSDNGQIVSLRSWVVKGHKSNLCNLHFKICPCVVREVHPEWVKSFAWIVWPFGTLDAPNKGRQILTKTFFPGWQQHHQSLTLPTGLRNVWIYFCSASNNAKGPTKHKFYQGAENRGLINAVLALL